MEYEKDEDVVTLIIDDLKPLHEVNPHISADTLRTVEELTLDNYMSSTELASVILTRAINSLGLSSEALIPAIYDDTEEEEIKTILVTYPGCEASIVDSRPYESFRHHTLSQSAIKAFFDYGGLNFDRNN